MIVAIDGPAGSGKSSTAKLVAEKVKFLYLDTGAMYRVITLKCLRNNILVQDLEDLGKCVNDTKIGFLGSPPNVKVLMDNLDVSTEIRSDIVTKNVSDYCEPMVVRNALVDQQRQIAGKSNVICEGRDIGTVVFPNAELKFFMTASIEARAKRRKKDFKKMGVDKSIKELMSEIDVRDKQNSSRENSPLCRANDAELLDTTGMTLEEQVGYIISQIAICVIKNSGIDYEIIE